LSKLYVKKEQEEEEEEEHKDHKEEGEEEEQEEEEVLDLMKKMGFTEYHWNWQSRTKIKTYKRS
jgi:hypothetical protein